VGIRTTVGSILESTIGRERTSKIRKAERKARNALAKRIAMDPPKLATKPPVKPATPKPKAAARPARWQPSDPFVPHPEPTMTRHELLQGLHKKTQPRTYLEIGIRTGRSAYAQEEPYLLRPDPQTPPPAYLDRSIAIEPEVLLKSSMWEQLVAIRRSETSADLSPIWAESRSLLH
jgi:hypothetical protein